MSEHDDDLPPELDVAPELFKFRQIAELKIAAFTEKPPWRYIRTSTLAVANEFGATFVGVPTGVKVLSSSSLLKSKSGDESSQHEIASIALRKQPTWISVSSDNLTLSVCCCSEEGIQFLYFDIRNIFNKAKAIKTPFYQNFLSKSKEDTVTSLMWNPSKEYAHLLALSLSNGELYVISVKDSNPTILKNASVDACAVCWNVDGKQLLVGKGDGSLCQLNQSTYDVEQSISVSDVIAGEVRTCDLLWISDCDIATVFTPSGGDDTPKLILAKLAEKNQFSNIAWNDYDEPSSGFGESRPTQLYLELVRDWDFFVYVSSNSTILVVLAKNKATGVWEIWNMEDNCRAILPLSNYNDEDSAAIGVSVITGHGGSHPVLAVLTDDCILCLFEMVNCMDGYSSIVNEISMPDLKEERVAVKSQDLKSDTTGQEPAPTFQKQKLTAKPSIFPNINPLGANQGFLQMPKSASTKATSNEKSLGTASTNFRSSSPLLLKAPEVQPAQNLLPSKQTTNLAFSTTKASVAFPTTKASVAFPTTRASAAFPTTKASAAFPTTKASTCNRNNEAKQKPSIQEHIKVKAAFLSRQRDSSVRIKHHPDVKSTIREISEFEEELLQVQTMSEDTAKTVDSMLERYQKPPELQKLSEFKQNICDTTVDVGREIDDLSTELLTLLSDAKQATQKKLLKADGFYKEMMYNRPLDQSQRRRYSDLLNLYRYVVTSSQEANTHLDYLWQNDEGIGSSQKQGCRGKAREWETARQALVSNMRVFHDLQVKILRLSQEIDRLQISKRIALSETMAVLSPRSNRHSGRSPRSLLIKRDEDTLSIKTKGSASDGLAPEKKLSAVKQYKLGRVLAQRDNKKVIRADLSKTSILRSENKTKSSESSVTVFSESELATDGTTSPSTETGGQDYSETDESSEESETTVKLVSEPPPISMTPQGSATLAYGAPKLLGHIARPISKPFNLAANEESKMNLNHPPQVVNIQTIAKPIYKGPTILQKFEPRPEVPTGAVEVVQSVLETVKAEKAQPVPENWKFASQGKEEEGGGGGDVVDEQPEPTSSIFQMKYPQKTPFLSASTEMPSPTPPSYTFSTPFIKSSLQSGNGLFGKPQPKEPVALKASTAGDTDFKLQTPSINSIFNIAASSSKPSGNNLFSGAPPFSSTPAILGEAAAKPGLLMERKTLFSALSPVPASETASSDRSTPSITTTQQTSSPITISTNMSAPVMAQPPTPVPASLLSYESSALQRPATPPVAASKPATPPVTVATSTPPPVTKPVTPSPPAVVSSSLSMPMPVVSSDAVSSTTVTLTENTQSQAADVVKGPSPPTPESSAPQALPSSNAAVLSVTTTASSLPPAIESVSMQNHPFGTKTVPLPSISVATLSTSEIETSQLTPSSSTQETSVFNTELVFGSQKPDSTFSTASGFGGFGSLSVGDKPVAAGMPKNPFQTAFGGDSTSNEPASQSSIFGQMSQKPASSPFGSANNASDTTSQANPFGTPATQSSLSSFASPTNSGVGSQGFGGFNKTSMGGFGGPAKFGGTPSFGSSPFGTSSHTFGSGFGTSAFGTTANSEQNKGFSAFGSGTSTSFGTLANQGGSSVFGSFGNQGGSTFGSVANQADSSGFGALAIQGNSNQGGSTFGSMANQNNSPGFGMLTSQGSTSVFGNQSSNQGSSAGFGSLASQGTGSPFGGSSSAFGTSGNNQSGSTGFGVFGGQSGSSLGGFGGMQQNQSTGGFGVKPEQSSFTGWR